MPVITKVKHQELLNALNSRYSVLRDVLEARNSRYSVLRDVLEARELKSCGEGLTQKIFERCRAVKPTRSLGVRDIS